MMRFSSFAHAGTCAAVLGLSSPGLAGDFEGPYVGTVVSFGTHDPGLDYDMETSVFVGHNFKYSDRIIVGGELDLTINENARWDSGLATITTVGARIGYLVTESLMVYGRAGGGYNTAVEGTGVWDIGAGGEYMLKGSELAVRGEVDMVDQVERGMATQMNAGLGLVLNF